MFGLGMAALVTGFVLAYSGIRAYDPRCVLSRTFQTSLTCTRIDAGTGTAIATAPARPGRHGRGVASVPGRITYPLPNVCKQPPKMTRRGSLRLQPAAMIAFRHAEQLYGGHIIVTSSYRSCLSQRAICATNPGPCAKPGQSLHQYGLAVDIASPRSPKLIEAMTLAGWRQFSEQTDSEHWSYGVTG